MFMEVHVYVGPSNWECSLGNFFWEGGGGHRKQNKGTENRLEVKKNQWASYETKKNMKEREKKERRKKNKEANLNADPYEIAKSPVGR